MTGGCGYDRFSTSRTAFFAAGFRKTGLLASGVLVDGKRVDAILWTRKLADPSGGADSSTTDDDKNDNKK